MPWLDAERIINTPCLGQKENNMNQNINLDFSSMSVEQLRALREQANAILREQRQATRVVVEKNKSGIEVVVLYAEGSRIAHTRETWNKISKAIADVSETGPFAGILY